MKPKTTIILAAILFLCIAFALVTSDLFKGSEKEKTPPAEQKLFTAAPAKAVKIAVQGRTGSFVFQKTDDQWLIVQPIQARAEAWRVDGIADVFKDLRGKLAEDVGNDTTGLDKPLWTVTLTDDKKATFALEVGRPRPLESDQTYVRPAGGKTYIVKTDFAYKLDKPLGDFRDKTVLDLKTDQIARVAITGAESFELVRKKDDWSLAKPVSAPADKDKVRDVLNKFSSLSVSEFVTDKPGDLAVYGLDKPRLIAQVQMEAEKPKVQPTTATTAPAEAPKPGKEYGLALGAQVGDKLYGKLTDSPTIFKVNATLLKDLQPKVMDLRDKKVLHVEAADVAQVDLDVPDGKASLVKTDDKWEMAAPRKGPAAADGVKGLLDKIAGLKAESFKDEVGALSIYGLDKPVGRITLRLTGKAETLDLLIGSKSPSGEATFVKSGTGLAVAVVPTADLEALLANPAKYWDPVLLKVPFEAKLTSLELRRTDGTYKLARDANDTWSLSAPLKTQADKDQLNKIVDDLKDLKAEQIVALGAGLKDVPDKYAKATDTMQVVFTTLTTPPAPATQPATQPATRAATQPAATQPAATRPAATQPAGPKPKPVEKTYQLTVVKVQTESFAWLTGGGELAIGRFAGKLYDDLAGELRDRAVWKLLPDKITDVKLVAGEDSLQLQKDKDTWKYTPDPYVKIDATKVADFLKAIQDLKAERFLSHTSAPADLAKAGLDKPWLKLELIDEKGGKIDLAVSNKGTTATEDRTASASTAQGVFVLSASALEKLGKKLKDFKQ